MASSDHNAPKGEEIASRDMEPGVSKEQTVQPSKVAALVKRKNETTRPESNVLDAARMQWQLSDWDSLASLSTEAISSDPARGTLALLVACGLQLKGNHIRAREILGRAMTWGCDRRLAARLLISSLHVTLGRAKALQGDERRALDHFRESTKGVAGDPRLAHQVRIARELKHVGLARDAGPLIRTQDVVGAVSRRVRDERAALSQLTFHGRHPPLSACIDSENSLKRPCVLVAGMVHSGSTALYNVVRLAMKNAGVPFVSGYAEQEGAKQTALSSGDARLIKIHEYRDDIAGMADFVITTRRDLRDTVASAARRKFPAYRTRGGAVAYARYNRSLYDVWAERSDYEFVYERFMQSPVPVIQEVLSALGLDDIDATTIFEEVRALPTDDYTTTLLSPSHVTDPQRVHTYADTLSLEHLREIEEQHFEWLSKFDYRISAAGISRR